MEESHFLSKTSNNESCMHVFLCCQFAMQHEWGMLRWKEGKVSHSYTNDN